MAKFNEGNMMEIETIFSTQHDSIQSELVADILNIFDYANQEGKATICDKGFSKASNLINFIADYCTTRHIEHDILFEEGFFNLYLY